jgi:primosomal protein N' (replication factor Y)
MPTFVEVAVNVPQVSGEYHYHLPDELENQIRVGHLVSVPFGRRTVQGVITGFVQQPEVQSTKAVSGLIDPQAVLTGHQIQFARQLSQDSLSSLSTCIALMLPPGLAQRADVLYTPMASSHASLSETQKRLLRLLDKRGPLRGQQLERALGRMNWRAAARSLVQRKLLKAQSILPPPDVHPKYVRTAALAVPPDVAENAMPTLARGTPFARLKASVHEARSKVDQLARPGTKTLKRRQLMLDILIQHPEGIDVSSLYKKSGGNHGDLRKLVDLDLVELVQGSSPALERRQAILRYLLAEPEPVAVTWLYAGSGGNLSDLYALEELGLIVLGESEVWRDPVEKYDLPLVHPPVLTQDQQVVWDAIETELTQSLEGRVVLPILLHGVTGSGKTEIYLRAVRKTIDCGKQAIVLVPEIALTPQTVRRFAARFKGQVGLFHSGLSQGERYDTWRKARMGELAVVVGPRSALFTPFDNLGLIVVDESHDDTYYQEDPEPRYHTRDAAISYANLTGSLCILGSATPDVVSYYDAKAPDQGKPKSRYLSLPARIIAHHSAVQAQLTRLGERRISKSKVERGYQSLGAEADGVDLPPVQVVDMRLELQSGNRSIFSRELQTSLKQVLDASEQAILFLNRRGSATYVFCRDCGNSLHCPRCDIPLTYHGSREKLICHRCGYQRNNPSACPVCGSGRIRHYGTGTQRVEAEVQQLFPHARTLRWDYETTRKKGSHDLILSHFSSHRADVLVGTQMLAKGLDLPLVTLVGVVLADVGLNLPDYRAAERTFQVLTQVAGRAGRSPLGGKVILQTFLPEHYVIRAAACHGFEEFYLKELSYRRQLGYPPFNRLVKLEYRDLKADRAEKVAHSVAASIREWLQEEGRRSTYMIGPVPCFFSRVGGYYRWQIVLSGPDPAGLLRGRPLPNWKVYVNPTNLL